MGIRVGSYTIFKAPGLGGLKPQPGSEGGECARGGCGVGGSELGSVSASHCFPKNTARTGPPDKYRSSAFVLLAPLPVGNESRV